MRFLCTSVCVNVCACVHVHMCLCVHMLGQKYSRKSQKSIPNSDVNMDKGWCNMCETVNKYRWVCIMLSGVGSDQRGNNDKASDENESRKTVQQRLLRSICQRLSDLEFILQALGNQESFLHQVSSLCSLRKSLNKNQLSK